MTRVTIQLAACVSALALTTTCAASSGKQTGVYLRQVARASSPIYLASTPSEPNRLYIVEQRGVIRVLVGGALRKQPFLNISSRVVSGGEQGLLSLAFDPQYAKNRRFYVNYTDTNGNTRVVRFRSNGARAILSSAKLLLLVRQPYANHNGGQLQFGPDGRLYVGMGDGGSGGDPQNRAQNLGVRLGKLLRANVNAKRIRWSIAGYGLRNPWRFSFDRSNGSLYIGDVGQSGWEEVDFLPRSRLAKLSNYGWSVFEGTHSFKPSEPLNGRGRLIQPVDEYSHADGNCSVTGGYVYRGKAQPALRGRYFFGDYCSGTIWSLRINVGKATSLRREPIKVPSLSSFGQNAAGELYALSLDGPIYRIT